MWEGAGGCGRVRERGVSLLSFSCCSGRGWPSEPGGGGSAVTHGTQVQPCPPPPPPPPSSASRPLPRSDTSNKKGFRPRYHSSRGLLVSGLAQQILRPLGGPSVSTSQNPPAGAAVAGGASGTELDAPMVRRRFQEWFSTCADVQPLAPCVWVEWRTRLWLAVATRGNRLPALLRVVPLTRFVPERGACLKLLAASWEDSYLFSNTFLSLC